MKMLKLSNDFMQDRSFTPVEDEATLSIIRLLGSLDPRYGYMFSDATGVRVAEVGGCKVVYLWEDNPRVPEAIWQLTLLLWNEVIQYDRLVPVKTSAREDALLPLFSSYAQDLWARDITSDRYELEIWECQILECNDCPWKIAAMMQPPSTCGGRYSIEEYYVFFEE